MKRTFTRWLAAIGTTALLGAAVTTPASADEIGPDLTPDVVKFAVGGVLSDSTSRATLPADVRWKQFDPDGICARQALKVETYDPSYVVRSYAVAAKATSRRIPLRANTYSYFFGMRTTDCAGNPSDYSDYASTSLVQSAAARLSPGWQTTSCTCWSNGDAVRSNKRGAEASYRFYGNSFALITAYAPDRGKANVYVDGALVGTMDTYRPTKTNRVVGFQRMFATQGYHTVKVVTTTEAMVTLDAFVTASR